MASTGSKKKKKNASSDAPVISTRRKLEVLGLVLMVFAILLTLAFVTYNPGDDAIARALSLGDAIVNPADHQAQFRVRNALGIVGAELAMVMVPGFLGYTVIALTGLLFAWGFAVFRHLDPRRLVYATGLTAISTFVVATLIGWFGHTLETENGLLTWAGSVGVGTAGWMQRIFGVTGSFILLLLAVTVMLLLVVDHDIQRSIDRVVDFVKTFRERVRTRYVEWNEKRARRKLEMESQRTERQKEREAARRKREAAIEEERRKQEEKRQRAEAHQARLEKQEETTATSGSSPTDSREQAAASDAAPRLVTPDESSASPAPKADSEAPDQISSAPEEANTPVPPSPSPSASSSDGAAEGGRSSSPGMTIRNDLFRDRLHSTYAPPSESTDDEVEEVEGSDTRSDNHAPTESGSARPGNDQAPSDEDFDLDDMEADFSEAFDRVEDQVDDEELDDDPFVIELEPSVQENETSDADTDDISPEDDLDSENSDEEDRTSQDVELQVQEQVEEERAEDIERPADVPEELPYTAPSIALLDESQESDRSVDRDELEENKRILLDKLETYNVEIQDIKAVVGPTVTRYELTPAPGIKVSRIKSLEDDLAMAMAAQGIRMIAPIPGKSAVGIEIPNRNRELVRLREVIGTAKFRDTDMELPFPLGKSIEGEVFLADLTKMPHLLIAGATGSGKSVGLNTLLTGLLYACHPSNLKFVIIDPKKIELQQYSHLDEHFIARPEDLTDAVVTDVDEALGVLKSCEKEMEERYDLLSEASVRGIRAYNRKFKEGSLDPDDGHRHMPYIVVVVDELADLMMTAGKEIEGPIARLAQMARAVGIHLVLATQRPSVDVITGLIKANFPSRIAYEVASRVDSRTILDQIGAEGLVGNGDLLYLSGSTLRRLQGPFVSVDEVERIVDYIADQPGHGAYELPSLSDAGHGPDVTLGVEDTDDLFEEGARVIVRRQQGSVSLLQRKLAVGYTRAARIVDQLEEAGIVGPFNGTKARDVLVDDEQQLDRLLSGEDDEDE
ncbi:cell division protein FtsK [Longibacter salinarum]|uniref:Cell division protein FtsK n=1 Tax=Longibacter salinarum TaxID=1850348 RepID=A0A2A8D217_9BACT|nr:DNA translocase FtsK 4TM domain-containing protein [Longibacter salinarum]PEN14930.1 cell division protein FtsK [Longibacter salinarum]